MNHRHNIANPKRKVTPVAKITEKAQAFVIIALAFVILLGFVGLVTDVGSVYVSWTQLKRAIDASAVAAANNLKGVYSTTSERKLKMTEAARETLALNNVSDISTLKAFSCEDLADPDVPAEFIDMCPDVANGEAPRKLAWIEATQDVPIYFLAIFGFHDFPITLSSVGEAATLDLVIVIDTSESMGINTPGFDANDFDPTNCNNTNSCLPLQKAKNAAKKLIERLYPNYDRVAIVTFDYQARIVFALSENIGNDNGLNDGDAYAAIDWAVRLHDDAPNAKFAWNNARCSNCKGKFSPIFPEDRDGDGLDSDSPSCVPISDDSRMDASGEPCDLDGVYDVYDWNGDSNFTNDNGGPTSWDNLSRLSTCTGCGFRIGSDVLADGGRPGGVWIMVFLSDGVANLSDNPQTDSSIPNYFTYGFCGLDFWSDFCIDWDLTPRYCIDTSAATCPPGTTHTTSSGPYSVSDYAYDMIDRASLLYPADPDEPIGEDIVIYSIGLGEASTLGESLLRYAANIGDDGAREDDACQGVSARRNCGNYYYAPDAAYLDQIFESIAGRIFTKISR